jgi:hypothetical protein
LILGDNNPANKEKEILASGLRGSLSTWSYCVMVLLIITPYSFLQVKVKLALTDLALVGTNSKWI